MSIFVLLYGLVIIKIQHDGIWTIKNIELNICQIMVPLKLNLMSISIITFKDVFMVVFLLHRTHHFFFQLLETCFYLVHRFRFFLYASEFNGVAISLNVVCQSQSLLIHYINRSKFFIAS
jgi:hypothetical protein